MLYYEAWFIGLLQQCAKAEAESQKCACCHIQTEWRFSSSHHALALKNKNKTKKPCNDSLLQDTGVLMRFAPLRRLTRAIRMNQPFAAVT